MAAPDEAALGDMLAVDAVTVRDAMLAVMKRWGYVRQLGESAPHFAEFNHLATLAQVYFGLEAQPEVFNFDDALALARRGQ